jgi:hypothetical protein
VGHAATKYAPLLMVLLPLKLPGSARLAKGASWPSSCASASICAGGASERTTTAPSRRSARVICAGVAPGPSRDRGDTVASCCCRRRTRSSSSRA